jgi:hypothetical protein
MQVLAILQGEFFAKDVKAGASVVGNQAENPVVEA